MQQAYQDLLRKSTSTHVNAREVEDALWLNDSEQPSTKNIFGTRDEDGQSSWFTPPPLSEMSVREDSLPRAASSFSWSHFLGRAFLVFLLFAAFILVATSPSLDVIESELDF